MEREDLPWIAAHDGNWDDLDYVAQQFATRRWCWNRYIEVGKRNDGFEFEIDAWACCFIHKGSAKCQENSQHHAWQAKQGRIREANS